MVSCLVCFFVALICTAVAGRMIVVPMPGGAKMSVCAALIGAVIGPSLFGHFGPALLGVALLPCVIGASILLIIMAMFSPVFFQRTVY